jgi:hypothetical protein
MRRWDSMDELWEKPPEVALDLLKEDVDVIRCTTTWEVFAESVSSRATCNSILGRGEVKGSAKLAIFLFDRLAEVCEDPSVRASRKFSSMGLRTFMINHYGPVPGDAYFDPATVEDWLFRYLALPFDEAVALSAKSPTDLPTKDFLRLSAVMNVLRLVRGLYSKGLLRVVSPYR